jgi:uncharacterized protein (TIGR04255 family)
LSKAGDCWQRWHQTWQEAAAQRLRVIARADRRMFVRERLRQWQACRRCRIHATAEGRVVARAEYAVIVSIASKCRTTSEAVRSVDAGWRDSGSVVARRQISPQMGLRLGTRRVRAGRLFVGHGRYRFSCCFSCRMSSMVIMTGNREVYPNAPVALVAVEARHTAAPPFTPEQEAELKALIGADFPIAQPVPTLTLNFGVAPTPQALTQPPRFTNRERTVAVTFGPQAVVIETTHHDHFGRLSDLVSLVVGARQKAAPVDGLERLGIRYVDEIRVPSDPATIDWSEWVEPSLLGPIGVGTRLGFQPGEHQGVATFQLGDDRGLNVRYGPRVGYAVQSGPLVRTMPPPSPFFLLDIDSFWTATDGIPEFDPSRIVALCIELHAPVNALFEALITERLREEVLRHA